MSSCKKDTWTYEKLMDALEYKNYSYSIPAVGTEFSFGFSDVTILGPVQEYEDANNSSLCLTVKCGEDTFLFTGDAMEEAETDMLEAGVNVSADVYHVGHHGSKTSSSAAFMETVLPKYGVISCAEENEYGHPHAQTLNQLRKDGISVYRTDEQGSIVAISNGTGISWSCSPSETWQAGERRFSSAEVQ